MKNLNYNNIADLLNSMNSEQLDIFVEAMVKIHDQSDSVRQSEGIKRIINEAPQFQEWSKYLNR